MFICPKQTDYSNVKQNKFRFDCVNNLNPLYVRAQTSGWEANDRDGLNNVIRRRIQCGDSHRRQL